MSARKSEKMIRITLVRSPIGRQPVQRRTVRALGLKRMNHSVLHKDTPEIAGMVERIKHLVDVEPWEEEKAESSGAGEEASLAVDENNKGEKSG